MSTIKDGFVLPQNVLFVLIFQTRYLPPPPPTHADYKKFLSLYQKFNSPPDSWRNNYFNYYTFVQRIVIIRYLTTSIRNKNPGPSLVAGRGVVGGNLLHNSQQQGGEQAMIREPWTILSKIISTLRRNLPIPMDPTSSNDLVFSPGLVMTLSRTRRWSTPSPRTGSSGWPTFRQCPTLSRTRSSAQARWPSKSTFVIWSELLINYVNSEYRNV